MLLGGKLFGHEFQKKIGFCEQMDIHEECSAIKGAFEFSALLRQPPHVLKEEKAKAVLEMLDQLCAKPTSFLFLDEPTSGLDGQGAVNILNLLRRLSGAGQAIPCTIHQATQEQFALFDNVLALNPGGNTFYFGAIGNSGETTFKYFGDYGVPVEGGKNVADFLIEVGVGILKSNENSHLDFNQFKPGFS
ncbi:uncharacterized protein BP5553_04220 [Venustampulla echinocandica]|uniref:ABC transporter family G domain-containing protein n=1 Tax=Venustampulla echinocandica TaxID=2656787 RepID=A0A370TWH7_9HELO|nr:uncharacterized protein BP5553_04220 [Venustampulla echinocandica]RDL39880.1 hypothetical protein BP5553_04220 [Venustampulla echinocandica]